MRNEVSESCRTRNKNKPNQEATKRSINLWHRGKEVHSEAFKSICSLVEDQFITGGDVLGLKDAFNNYVPILKVLDAKNLVASYTAQTLEEKLKLHFKERIIIHKKKCKRGGSLVYNCNIALEEAFMLADLQKSKLDQLIKDLACTLRAIISATRTNLPSSGIMFDDIIDGKFKFQSN